MTRGDLTSIVLHYELIDDMTSEPQHADAFLLLSHSS